MSEASPSSNALLTLYDSSVADVYGYLRRRCGSTSLAEDLTSDTFFAAADAIRRGSAPTLTPSWLMTVARNKLVDHWRRQEREQRALKSLSTEPEDVDDGAGDTFQTDRALAVLGALGPHHQAVLTLRYLDGLSVPAVAHQLGRTVHATEALLMRAKDAFRRAYTTDVAKGDGNDV